MTATLLDENATPLMRALDEVVGERMAAMRLELARNWNPETCPVELLPHLAWVARVFLWDGDWTDEKKRRAILWTMRLRKLRGTLGAVKDGLEALGLKAAVVPWWQEQGDTTRSFDASTMRDFQVFAWANDNLDNDSTISGRKIELIRQVVEALKPLKSRYDLELGVRIDAEVQVSVAFRPVAVVRFGMEIEA